VKNQSGSARGTKDRRVQREGEANRFAGWQNVREKVNLYREAPSCANKSHWGIHWKREISALQKGTYVLSVDLQGCRKGT